MSHEMTEDTLRTRIRKFRDPRSNPTFRLKQAEEIVDFVEHVMLNAFTDEPDENPEAEDDVVEAEIVEPRADLAGPEVEVPEAPAETAEPDSE